jgi:hypothetical protein
MGPRRVGRCYGRPRGQELDELVDDEEGGGRGKGARRRTIRRRRLAPYMAPPDPLLCSFAP